MWTVKLKFKMKQLKPSNTQVKLHGVTTVASMSTELKEPEQPLGVLPQSSFWVSSALGLWEVSPSSSHFSRPGSFRARVASVRWGCNCQHSLLCSWASSRCYGHGPWRTARQRNCSNACHFLPSDMMFHSAFSFVKSLSISGSLTQPPKDSCEAEVLTCVRETGGEA